VSLLDLAFPSDEVLADLDGVRVAAIVAQVPAVRRVEAGMDDGELNETTRSEHPEDLGQHTLRLGYVHEAHKRRHEVEARRLETQVHGAREPVVDAKGMRGLGLVRVADESL
jgi:hypothetical protein